MNVWTLAKEREHKPDGNMILLLIKSSTYSHVSKSTILPDLSYICIILPALSALIVSGMCEPDRVERRRLLKFSKIDMTGGFIAKYANTGKGATPARSRLSTFSVRDICLLLPLVGYIKRLGQVRPPSKSRDLGGNRNPERPRVIKEESH